MQSMRKIILSFLLLNAINVYADDSQYFEFIDELYKQRNFEQALVESEKYLHKFPDSKYREDMKDKIAKLYFLKEDYKKAAEIFKSLYIIENKESLKDEHSYYLARSYAELGDLKELKFYINNIKNGKVYLKGLYEVGISLMRRNYNEEAAQIFSKLAYGETGVYGEESLFNLGIAYYNSRNYEKADRTLNEYMKNSNPGEKKLEMIKYLIASSLYKSDKDDVAISHFKDLVEKNTGSIYWKKSLLTLIEIYANRNDFNTVNQYLEMVQGTEEYNTAMIILGDLYVSQKKYEEAISMYHRSNDLNIPRLIYGEAYSLYKLGRHNEALKKFSKLKDRSYYNQAIYHMFAIAYKNKEYQKIVDSRNIMKRIVVTQTDTDNINTMIANSAYQLGNYKLAKDYYGRLFAISTKKENLFRVILLDSQILDIEDLEDRFNQYRKLFPNDNVYKKDIFLYTGDAYHKIGSLGKAETIYKEYLKYYSNFEVLSSLLVNLLEQKKYDEMEQYLSSVSDEDKLNYLKGIVAVGTAKYAEAENYFQKSLAVASQERVLENKIALNRVRNFFLWGKYNEAINIGEQTLTKLDKNRDAALYMEALDKIGLSYFRMDKYDKAREYYSKIAEMDGYEVYGNFQIADSYYNQKDYDKAATLYKKLYTSFEETFYGEQAHYKYLKVLSMKNNRELFEEERSKFVKNYPKSRFKNSLMNMTANYYAENNDVDKAVNVLDEIKTSSGDSFIKENNNIKIINLKLKNKDYKDIEKYIAELSSEEEQTYYLSKLYSSKKEYDLLVKEYEKLLKFGKYVDYAAKNLGDYWYSKKNNSLAKKYYDLLLKNNKYAEEEYILYRLALIDEGAGNIKEALSNYTKVFEKYNGKYKLDSMLKVAEIYDKQENVEEAKKIFFKLYKIKNNKEVRIYTLEKLIYYRLLENNENEAKKYYTELQKLSSKNAEKFKDYF